MGQRLNIEIIKNNQVLANAYYHWSAYTSSALQLVQTVLTNIKKEEPQDSVEYAIFLLESTGARLTEEEINQLPSHFSKEAYEPATSRNDGLIAVSKEGMRKTREWEEHRVQMDLDEKTVSFDVMRICEKEDFLDDYEETEEKYQSLPQYSLDYHEISFDTFQEVAEKLAFFSQNRQYYLRQEDGSVLCFVE